MLIKRLYDQAGKCAGVLVKHTGSSERQNFSHRLIEDGVANGWVRIDGNTLTITAAPEDLVYKLERTPGYYCKSSGDRIPISPMAWASSRRGELARAEALRWLAEHEKPATDYEVTNAYECVLSKEQHKKYRAARGPKGRILAAHKA